MLFSVVRDGKSKNAKIQTKEHDWLRADKTVALPSGVIKFCSWGINCVWCFSSCGFVAGSRALQEWFSQVTVQGGLVMHGWTVSLLHTLYDSDGEQVQYPTRLQSEQQIRQDHLDTIAPTGILPLESSQWGKHMLFSQSMYFVWFDTFYCHSYSHNFLNSFRFNFR